MNRKERLFILALGREIIPYDAYFSEQSRMKTPTLKDNSNLGAWYNCKTELRKEGLITELRRKGRNKPIRVKMPRYFDLILKDISVSKDFREENEAIFEKYAPRIVDHLIKGKLLEEANEVSYPFVFFLLTRYKITIGRHIKTPLQKIIGDIDSFLNGLSDNEKEELIIQHGKQEEIINVLFRLIPSSQFKAAFTELGSKVLETVIFKKEQFDHMLNLAYNFEMKEELKEAFSHLLTYVYTLETKEDIDYLIDKAEERRRQKEVEQHKEDEKEKAEFLKELGQGKKTKRALSLNRSAWP